MSEDEQAVADEREDADASGADSAEGKTDQQSEEDADKDEAASTEEGDEDDASAKAQQAAEERERAKEEIKELEEGDPPADLEDWPEGAAKYETYGGPEGEHGYHEGPEEKMGPSSLRHHSDGSVEIEGEKVDDPDKYKGDPIPGGPTDPDAPKDLTTEKIRGKMGDDDEGDDEGEDGESESSENE